MKILLSLSIVLLITSAYCANTSAQTTDTSKTISDTSEVFQRVETIPEFKGGIPAFMKFLNKNIKYPKQARQDNIEGRVILTFVVEKDGTLTGLRILRGVSPEIDQEALRVMGISPPWTPGTQNGKPVRVQFSIPIAFSQS
jgi:TonB family protein